jgi:serine/threonine-protein kinase
MGGDVTTIGPYRLEKLIGFGGMGEVHLAYDTRRSRMVALKLLPEALSRDPEFQERFRRESHVAARLRDPHVIPIHDYGEVDGHLFIDMRLVDGRTIRELLEADGPMPPARAVHLLGQVAEALEAAHADGLVHRDVKPSNVLVTATDFVYVVDFGIARSVGSTRAGLTLTGVTVGTLDYMAPERFARRAIDGRTDVYSLACLMYECLTGVPPYGGDDLPTLMYAHLYADPPGAGALVPGVPPALDEVIAKGMAKEPDDRFAGPSAMLSAARAALADAKPDEPPAARPVAPADTVAASPVVAGLPVPERSTADDATVAAAVPDATPAALTPALAPTPAPALPPLPPESAPTVRTAYPPPPGPVGGSGPPPARSRALPVAVAVVLALVVAAAAVLVGVTIGRSTTATPGSGTAAEALPIAPPEEPGPVAPAASIAIPQVREVVPVGPTPGYMHIAPGGRYAYIASRAAGVVTVLDTTINAVTATIPVPAGPPQFVSFSPDGTRAYVSIFNPDFTVNLVGVIDTASNTLLTTIPVGRRPYASATTPDGSRLYVPSHDDGRIDVIDTATSTVVAEIPVAPNPHWVAFSPDGSRLWAANHESNVVSELDPATNAILGTVAVGTSPHSTVVSPDGTRVAVVNFDSNEVSVIDTATRTVVATVPVGTRPQDVAYAPDGRYLYTANVEGDSVSVIDAATNTVTATIPAGDGPTSVAVRADGTQAYVTLLNEGNVLVLDTSATG